jgi:hypothetical protein
MSWRPACPYLQKKEKKTEQNKQAYNSDNKTNCTFLTSLQAQAR